MLGAHLARIRLDTAARLPAGFRRLIFQIPGILRRPVPHRFQRAHGLAARQHKGSCRTPVPTAEAKREIGGMSVVSPLATNALRTAPRTLVTAMPRHIAQRQQ